MILFDMYLPFYFVMWGDKDEQHPSNFHQLALDFIFVL